MRDDRRSYRPLEQSCRLGPCQELRQMNLGRVTFPPSRSSHARPGNRPHPPVGGKEWRDETPPVGVTAISVEKQEAGFPPPSPGEGFDRSSRPLARSPFGRYGTTENGS